MKRWSRCWRTTWRAPFPHPFKQMGGYIKRNSGLKIYFKLENPYGQRIQRVFAGPDELNPAKTYRAAYVTPRQCPGKWAASTKRPA